jgi:O-antigen biosynthesis protein WbqV
MQVNFRTLNRATLMFAHDTVMAAASFVIALYLRLGQNPLDYSRDLLVTGTAIFTLVAVSVFWSMRLYRGIWRYASVDDLLQIIKAVSLAILVFVLALFWITRLEGLPRSTLGINWFVLVGLLAGPRLVYRMLKDRGLSAVFKRTDPSRIPVLLVGAGDGAELFIRAMETTPGASYRVVGLVDDKGTRVGRKIHGLDVMGDLKALAEIVARLTRQGARPQRLIVTENTLDGARMRALLKEAEGLGLTLARLPRLTDFTSGVSERLEVRPVALEDLLGRPQTVLDRDSMKALIAGRRVMITGAGGTIGSELACQIADFAPAHLTLLDNSEFALYTIDLEISRRHPGLGRSAILGDVRARDKLTAVFAAERPELVFHAAALKHVPLIESHADEAASINAIGTRNVADACRAAGIMAMVQISTDKAVNPVSVMGATKRLAESYCQALDLADATKGATETGDGGGRRTRFITVRFGNVLGSTGSVVPLFQKQLEAGGPITVTHPDVKRFFMTVREAVELVLEASALGVEAESEDGRIFVLDMGEPIPIVGLAKQMIRLAGLTPGDDIEIRFTGLRPGEKLDEELFHDAETPKPTRYAGVLLASPRTAELEGLRAGLDELAAAADAGDTARTLSLIARLVPEYRRAVDDEAEEPTIAQEYRSNP